MSPAHCQLSLLQKGSGICNKKNAETLNFCGYRADRKKELMKIRPAHQDFSYELAIFNNLWGVF
jgi:hypothetical protein